MKKRKSVFWSTTLIIIPIVLLATIVVLVIAFAFAYTLNYKHSVGDITQAAKTTNEILSLTDLKNSDDTSDETTSLNELCTLFDIPYIYVLEINEEENTEKYLAIGIGEGASETFIQSRSVGYVINYPPNQYMLSALHGDGDDTVEHMVNQFGDTLVFYLKRSGENAENELICAEINIISFTNELANEFIFAMVATCAFVLFLVLLFALVIHYKVSKPARAISRKMSGFVREHEKTFEPLQIKGSGEFCEIAAAFNAMAEDIDRYLDSFSELNRQKAELNIARRIQMGLLEADRFENAAACIRAYMLPARDVGGDLYDYQVLPDGRLCALIADVSGKGVSAALFMSRAVTLIHQYAASGLSPEKILHAYNNQLAAHNPNMMFITTFVAVLDPQTGTLVYANAGHNDPYLISDTLIKLDGEHGMAAGIFADAAYTEHVVQVKPGDLLFLYTDGVTEAKNADGGLFGEEALEEELRGLIASPEKDAVSRVLEKLNGFTRDAEQADDITMLTLRVKPRFHEALHLEAKPAMLPGINEVIARMDVSEEMKHQLTFIAEEMFVNICSYAYPDGNGYADVLIDMDDRQVTMTFTDSGVPFDPTKDVLRIEDYDVDNDVGGLGRFLTLSFADGYAYRHDGTHNILTIHKNL